MATKIKQIIDIAQSSGDIQRRKKQADKFNCFLDNYEDLVLSKIKKQFHEDNYERLYKMVAAYYNIFKKVVNSKSLLYKKEASRKWYKRGGEVEDERYTEFVADTNIHTAMQMINKYANANNIAFMRIKPMENTVSYEAIPAENIVVMRDEYDPFKVTAVLHKIVVDHTFWLYTDNEITAKISVDFDKTYDQQSNELRDPNTGEGIIPYVPVWASPPVANDFWNYTVNDDLYNCTIQLNVHLTHFNNVLKTGCYKQLALLGLQTEDIKRMYNHIMDGANPLALTGEHADVKGLLMSEKYSEYIDSIDSIASRVLDQHGFDFESQSRSAAKASAMSIKLRQDAMDDLKEEQQPLFRDFERKVAYYTVAMGNQYYKAGIDISGTFEIDFFEEEQGIVPDDVAVYDWMMRNGFKSPVSIFQKFNPDVPQEMIEDRIKENIELYNNLLGTPEPVGGEIEEAFEEDEVVEEDETA